MTCILTANYDHLFLGEPKGVTSRGRRFSYCYAVNDRKLAQSRYKEHDPESEFLFAPKDYVVDEEGEQESELKDGLQMRLL
jgi:hypothetical protein